MRAREVLAIWRVARPLFDLRLRIRIAMDMCRSIANDPVVGIERDSFPSHLDILLLPAITALSAAATLLTDFLGCVATLHTLFSILVFDEVHVQPTSYVAS